MIINFALYFLVKWARIVTDMRSNNCLQLSSLVKETFPIDQNCDADDVIVANDKAVYAYWVESIRTRKVS